jgi:hypothetical protein
MTPFSRACRIADAKHRQTGRVQLVVRDTASGKFKIVDEIIGAFDSEPLYSSKDSSIAMIRRK